MSTPTAQRYYVRIRGKIIGPFPFEQLQSLRDRGRLQETHEVSRDRRNWEAASRIAGLFAASDSPGMPLAPTARLDVSESGEGKPSGDGDAWYYAKNNLEHGPVSWLLLQQMASSGELMPSDRVWNSTFPDWQSADGISGLFIAQAAGHPYRAAASRSYDSYQKVASRGFWDGVLNHVRRQISADDMDSICTVLIQVGGYALMLAMLGASGFLMVQAIKIDSIQLGLWAVGAFFGLAIMKYAAERLSVACHFLVRSSSHRLSSPAFLDATALVLLFIGFFGVTLSAVRGIQQTSLVQTIVWIASGLQLLLVMSYAACAALHPGWLNIDCSSPVRAGEEGIGLAAFFLKLCLRFAPIQFGVNAVIGTLGMMAALIMLIVGDDLLLASYEVALYSGVFLLFAGLAPLFFYLLMAFASVLLDLAQSILLIPQKLDRSQAAGEG